MKRLSWKNILSFVLGFSCCFLLQSALHPATEENEVRPLKQEALSPSAQNGRQIEVVDTWFPVKVNGEEIFSKRETFLYKDTLYVPLRKLADNMKSLHLSFERKEYEFVHIVDEAVMISPEERPIHVVNTWFPVHVNNQEIPREETFLYKDRLYLPARDLVEKINNAHIFFENKGIGPEFVSIYTDTGLAVYPKKQDFDSINLGALLIRYQRKDLPYVVAEDFSDISGEKPIQGLEKNKDGRYSIDITKEKVHYLIDKEIDRENRKYETVGVLVESYDFEKYKIPLLKMVYENEKYIYEQEKKAHHF